MIRCKKVRYRTELDAKIALSRIERGADDKHETGTYYCKPCHKWHLTSRGPQ